MSSKMMFHENCHFNNFKGEVFIKFGPKVSHEDVVKNPDYHFNNLIVDKASTLIAEWANADDNVSNHVPGILYLGIGTGDTGWDPFNPPLPDGAKTQLITEVGRAKRTPSVIPYVDNLGNNTSVPGPIVDFEFTFTAYPDVHAIDGILVEMGLFGGFATTAPNSGLMFNYLTFSAISKPLNAEMTIVWRVNFLPTSI